MRIAAVIDGREMVPPEPMERTIQALDTLKSDEEIQLLVYCSPQPLFNILRKNGYAWQENVHADGTHEILIHLA
jgi:uncharacterized protein (DUF2249 family)